MLKKLFSIAILATCQSGYAGIVSIGDGSTVANDCTIGCMAVYQQAYDSSYFGNSPIHLNTLSLYGQSGAYGTYDVSVGYMNGNYSSITTNFASNFASGSTLVDSVNLATEMHNNILTVDLNFDYDPTLGDLLIQFSRTSANAEGNFAAVTGYDWSRAYEWGAPYNGAPYNYGVYADHFHYALNSTFLTSAVSAVPEPGSLALLGLGVAGLVATRRNKNVQ